MEKIALYRKYRPSNFSSVYGQDVVVQTLKSAIKNNSINHAYIFAGPRGSGKTSIAKIFSRAINCLHPLDNLDSCGKCEACLNSMNDNCLDIVELDAASNNGINEIRNVINSVSFIPSCLKYKVYIIDEAHMLTTNSWNALLKTLEEPPSYAVFIFATTEYHKIPATIISRCQRFDFTRLSKNTLSHLLSDICEKEKIDIDNMALNTIVDLSDGAARDAISILDQLTSFTNKITLNDVNQVFGLINFEYKIDLLNSIFLKDVENVVLFLNEQYEKGINLTILISDLIKILFDKILYSQTNNLLFCKLLDEKNIGHLKEIPYEKMLAITNHLNQNLNKISKSNDQLFATQLILMQAIALIDDNNTSNIPQSNVNVSTSKQPQTSTPKVETKKVEDISSSTPNLFSDTETKTNEMFTTSVRMSHKPGTEDIIDTKPASGFVPPRPSSNLEPTVIKKSKLDDQSIAHPKPALTPAETKKEEPTPKKPDIDYKDFFFRVASNSNSECKEKMNQTFATLQEGRLLESGTINKFLGAKKFLVCSKNGAVLLFENTKQAENFNEVINSSEMKNWIKKHFTNKVAIIGIDKNIAKSWTEEFKLSNQSYEDVNPPKDVDSDTKSLILDILAD